MKENTCSDLPAFVPIPKQELLPCSMKKWLEGIDCLQVNAPIVQERANEVRANINNLIEFSLAIYLFCNHQITYFFPYSPLGIDAMMHSLIPDLPLQLQCHLKQIGYQQEYCTIYLPQYLIHLICIGLSIIMSLITVG